MKAKLPFKLRLLFSPRERRQQIVRTGPRLVSYHASAYITSGEVIKVHNTGYENMATVYIVDEGGRGLYIVDEPKVPEEVRNVYGLIMEHLSYSLKPAEVSNVEDYVKNLVWEAAEELGVIDIVEQHIKTLNYYIMRDVIGYGYIDVPMRDPLVEEISMEGPGIPVAVVHREISDYTWLDTNIIIPSEEEAAIFIQKLAQKCGKYISTAFPILEARSPEGHRIALALGEVSGRGSSFTVRKFPEKPLTITQLIDYGTSSPLMAAYFWILLENLAFILIIGGMASGKSLVEDTYVIVMIDNYTRLLKLGEVWNELVKRGLKPLKKDNMEFIDLANVDIKVLTLTDRGIRWVKPRYIIRHRVREKVVCIRTKTGREICVTKDHSLHRWSVKRDWSIQTEVVTPSGVKIGDYVPYLRHLMLLENLRAPKYLLDPRFGYLLGFFIAEGATSNWSLYQKHGESLNKVLSYIEALKIPYSISIDKRNPCIRIIYIKGWAKKILEHVIGHAKASTKRVPDLFWNMPFEWRIAFLAGIIDGDGSIHPGRYVIEITTASKDLAYGLLYAFASVNVHAYMCEKRVRKYFDRIYYRIFIPIGINSEVLKPILNWLTEEKKQRILKAIEKSSNHHSETDVVPMEIAYAIGSKLKWLKHGRDERRGLELRSYKYRGENTSFYRLEKLLGDKLYEFLPRCVGFDEVIKIVETEYDGYVYDFEVPETENFEANGIFVHNTTTLQALLTLGPPDFKYVTIEDTPELRLPHTHWDPLYTRKGYTIGSSQLDIDLFELTKFSLRRRGQYIVIGEVRGKEIRTLVQAAATGQGSACLPYDEFILVRRDGKVELEKIGKIVEDILAEKINKLEVLTYNEDNGKFEWKPIKRVFKVNTSRWIIIKTHEGRVLKVTPDHKLAVLVNGKIMYKRADEIKKGDFVLFMKHLETKPRYKEWDLFNEALKLGLGNKLYVDIREFLRANPDVYNQLLDVYKYAVDWRTRAFAPYSKIKHIAPREAIKVIKYGARARHTVKRAIPLDGKLGFIIGSYLAEGSVEYSEILFHLGKHEKDLVQTLSQTIEEVFGIKPIIREKETTLAVVIPCKLLSIIFKHLFGARAENKHLPDWMVFESPLEFIRGVIRGYWLGDGHIRRHGKSTYMALATTVSRKLAYQLHYILKRLGIDSSLRELPKRTARINGRIIAYKHVPYEIKIHGGRSMEIFAETMQLDTPCTAYTRAELMSKRKIKNLPTNLMVDVVKNVEVITVNNQEPSYDIEVEDNHNFTCNASILSSNCTFHANSIEEAFMRMTSPPLDVKPAFLMLIWAIVLMRRVRLRDRRVVRRMTRVWEVTGLDLESNKPIPLNYTEVFTWDPFTDSFNPTLPEEVFERSYRLKQVAEANGLTEGEIIEELRARAKYIEDMVKEHVFDYNMVSRRLFEFYRRKRLIYNP